MTDQQPQQPATPPPSASTSGTKQGRNISVGQILAAILFVLVVIFIVENSDPVDVRLIFPVVHDVPLFVVILIGAVVGGLIGSLLRYRRKKHHGQK